MTNVIRHNLTTGWFVCAIGIPFALVGAIPSVGNLAEKEAIDAALTAPNAATRDSLSREINQSLVGSDIPLKLVNANRCVPVALHSNGEPAEFLAGVEVVATTPNGQSVPPGSFVCSESGASATVGMDKTLVDVQNTQLSKMPEYKEAYAMLLEMQNRQAY